MKRLLLSLLLVSFFGILFAAKVDMNDAKTIAVNAYFEKLNTYLQPVDYKDVVISETYTFYKDNEPTVYAFNFENYGFILIAAEDAIEPVIGYGFDSQITSNNQPDNFRGLMEEYGIHIEYLRNNNIEASPEIGQMWNSLESFNPSGYTPDKGGKDIEPLITCTWNQDYPYNYYCPVDNQSPAGGRCYVGCVATAMSQIMLYWRYPHQGQGSHSYYQYPYGTQSANFGQTVYDWDAMVDNSDQYVNLPMALIGYHAAVSVDMDFGPDGSGSYSADVPYALSTYFKYSNNASYKQREYYTASAWATMIQTDLNANRPVYYSGFDAQNGGHAFVLDGYHSGDNMYHFNFGWSGSSNGWYLITNAGGFINGQGLINNIYPSDPNYPYGCLGDNERNSMVGSFEDGSGPIENYDQGANCSWLINPQSATDSVTNIKLHFVTMGTDPDDIVTIYDGPSMDDEVLGTFSGTTTPSGTFISTGNKMLVVFETDGDATTGAGWRVEYSSTLPSWCSGTTTFTAPSGTFDDGSGDFYYKNNTSCTYKIQPDWANGVTLTFDSFETEEVNDYVRIYDGSNSQVLGEYSGSEIPEDITVPSGNVFMVWKTDGAMNYPGWQISYTVGNVGVDEQATGIDKLSVYPNPASSRLNISFNQEITSSFSLKLLSVTGETVFSQDVSDFSGNYINSIDLSGIAKGVYFLNLSNDRGSVNEKVVIK